MVVAAVAEAKEEEAAAAATSTPQQSRRKRPRAIGSGRYRLVSRDLEEAAPKKPLPPPPKPELAPSSQGLDLGDLPVLDVFQVYSCLRLSRVIWRTQPMKETRRRYTALGILTGSC